MDAAVDKLGTPGNPAHVASAVEFILEGLHLNRRLNKDQDGARYRYRALSARRLRRGGRT